MDKTKKTTPSAESDSAAAVNEEKKECSCEGECKDCENVCENCEESARQAEEYKMKYLRAIADYQNYERRVQSQRVEWTKNANKTVILKLLSFLDDLERAEIFVKDPNLLHVKESFMKMLNNEGLKEIQVLNAPYDPYTAEVIDMKEGKEDNIVISVVRKGYTYNDQLLRVAQVVVSKKAEKKL
jgi:molecular chaperone GrpE